VTSCAVIAALIDQPTTRRLKRSTTRAPIRRSRLFHTLIKADLLILDGWGRDRLTANQRRDLMEIVEDPPPPCASSRPPSRKPRTSGRPKARRESLTDPVLRCLHATFVIRALVSRIVMIEKFGFVLPNMICYTIRDCMLSNYTLAVFASSKSRMANLGRDSARRS
jgi:hypothetical protein